MPIFDDFHLVDDAPDVQLIAREIVNHAPERLTVVFASRRTPSIAMAKLRATGEVAELTTDDLRFDPDETERLFRETYHRTLEPDALQMSPPAQRAGRPRCNWSMPRFEIGRPRRSVGSCAA